jgi:hypothetical protein
MKPQGGLANRLRSLASAMWAAEELGLKLVVSWQPDELLGSPIEALFRNHFHGPNPQLSSVSTIYYEEPTALNLDEPKQGDPDEVIEISSCQAFGFKPEMEAYTRPFWTGLRGYLRRLKPIRDISKMVGRVSSTFGRETLGVHVRSGRGGMKFDQASHIQNDIFFAEIDEILDRKPDTRIFLACDSPEVVGEFREYLGGKITTLFGSWGDTLPGVVDPEGMKMALADLLLLSKTRRILGSYFSSFSEIAAVLGACPVKRIGINVEGPGVEGDFLDLVDMTQVRPSVGEHLGRLKARFR